MSRDKKRTRHPLGDDDNSVLGPGLNSEHSSARNSRKGSRTNSASASRSRSRVRDDSENDECENAEELTDEEYQNLLKIALNQVEGHERSHVDPPKEFAMPGSVLLEQQQQQQQQQHQQQQQQANGIRARIQDISIGDDDDDEEEEDEEEEDDDDEEGNVIRIPLRAVVDKDSNHPYAKFARLFLEHGFVRKGTLDGVSVIPPQPSPTSEDASKALIFLALYPCGKDKEHSGNRTTNDLLDLLSRYGLAAFIFWCDAALMSANKTNEVFDHSKIGVALKANPVLQREFFVRFRDDVIALHNDPDFSKQNKYVVCVLCGKDIAEQAFDRWVAGRFITVGETLYGDNDNKHQVVCASFSFEGTNFEVLVVRGAHHPSAHLHAYQQQHQMKEAQKDSCSIIAATIQYAREKKTTTTTTTIKEYLLQLNATYIKTMKARESKWHTLLPEVGDWRKVFVAKNSFWYQNQFAVCRNMQLENHEVFKNVQTVFKTFGTELALKFLRTNGFAYRLGKVDTATVFVEKLLRVFKRYCNENRKCFAQFACGGLFAHLFDAEFFEKMDEIFAKYCGKDPKLFAQIACSGLFAHYRDAEFFEKMDEIFAKYCGKDPKLFAQIACSGLFAHYRDAEFFEKMDEIFEKYCGKDPKLFAKLACGGLFAHLFDAEFFEKMDEIFEKYCGKDPKLFAQIACSGLFAHYRDAEFFEKMDEIFEKYCGNDPKLFAKLAFNGSFLSAMSKHGESYPKTLEEARTWTVFQGDKGKALFEKAMVLNSFTSAITNGAFCDIMEGIHDSPAFVRNDHALKNLFSRNTIVSALAKYGEPFLTALEEEKDELFPNDNKRQRQQFARTLTRLNPGQGGKITLYKLVDNVTKKMNEQQSPP
ncbi:unnamed protein product [Bathycoccus prasinos]